MKLISRKNSQVIQKFRKLHTVLCTVWKLRKFSLTCMYMHFFGKNFVKVTFLQKKITKIKSRFHDFFFFSEREFLVSPQCGINVTMCVVKWKILLSLKFFPSNQLFGDRLVTFMTFLPKKWESKFPIINTLWVWHSVEKREIHFVRSIYSNYLVKRLHWQNFCDKIVVHTYVVKFCNFNKKVNLAKALISRNNFFFNEISAKKSCWWITLTVKITEFYCHDFFAKFPSN